jgi:release factor glutamine methyltransferase
MNRTVSQVRLDLREILSEGSLSNTERLVDWLLSELLTVDRAHLHAFPDRVLPSDSVERLRAWARRLRSGEPIQYVLGSAAFFGLRFHVTPDVLIPRPETECVVEKVLDKLPALGESRVLDIGTGSGCIAIAVKLRSPATRVRACDVSAAAIEVASGNAERLGAAVSFLIADIVAEDFVDSIGGDYDLIVSNPPYIPTDELVTLEKHVQMEPRLALNSGRDPLFFYRHIARVGKVALRSGGHLVLEVHSDYAREVADHLEKSLYDDVGIATDLTGLPRIVTGRRGGCR